MLTVADMGEGGLFEMLTSACILQNQGTLRENTFNLPGYVLELKSI